MVVWMVYLYFIYLFVKNMNDWNNFRSYSASYKRRYNHIFFWEVNIFQYTNQTFLPIFSDNFSCSIYFNFLEDTVNQTLTISICLLCKTLNYYIKQVINTFWKWLIHLGGGSQAPHDIRLCAHIYIRNRYICCQWRFYWGGPGGIDPLQV